MSFLDTLGSDIKKVFSWIGSPKGTAVIAAGEAVVEDILPGATAAINLANAWLAEIIKTQGIATAAAAIVGSSAIKAGAVINTLTPQILAFAAAQGLPVPDSAQILAANNGLVAFLNAFGTPATPPAA